MADKITNFEDYKKKGNEEDIDIQNAWGPKEVKVDEKGNVSGIVFKKCLRTIDPETGKFSPVYDENETIDEILSQYTWGVSAEKAPPPPIVGVFKNSPGGFFWGQIIF